MTSVGLCSPAFCGSSVLVALGVLAMVNGAPMASAEEPAAPAVVVSLRADTAALKPGGVTTVHAFAQVAPALAAKADRIFSWNVDLLVLDAEVLTLEPATLARPKSDHDTTLGSAGTVDGPHLRGIRDSFLNLAAAGVSEPVELFSVNLKAVAAGTCVVRVRPGTFGADASPDFMVLPKADEDPFLGGDYQAGTVTVTVAGDLVAAPALRWNPVAGGKLRLEVDVPPGATVAIEEADGLESGSTWRQVATGAAGTTVLVHEVGLNAPRRFYRAVRSNG